MRQRGLRPGKARVVGLDADRAVAVLTRKFVAMITLITVGEMGRRRRRVRRAIVGLMTAIHTGPFAPIWAICPYMGRC